MAFTAGHYNSIAAIIRDRAASGIATLDCRESEGYTTALRHLAEDLAAYFGRQNPRFDHARFIAACDPTQPKTGKA